MERSYFGIEMKQTCTSLVPSANGNNADDKFSVGVLECRKSAGMKSPPATAVCVRITGRKRVYIKETAMTICTLRPHSPRIPIKVIP